MKRLLALALALVAAIDPAFAAKVAEISSPDKTITVTVETDNDGRILYSVARNGHAIIAPSRMGFLISDQEQLMRGFAFTGSKVASHDETWEQPWGESRFVRDHHNELLVSFREKTRLGRALAVRFRVFDNGVGFRYEFPDQAPLKTVRIADELTEFNLAQNGTAWWIPSGDWNRDEQLYTKSAIDAVAQADTPISMKLDDGTYLAFHEAALVDYSAMWLRRVQDLRFRATLAPSSTGPRVLREAPFNTPWRTIRIGGTPGEIYVNYLELNLNEPNKIGDVSWFKPQKYIGIWWEMHRGTSSWSSGAQHGATTANALRYIDFAAEHGFAGVLIEGWNVGWDGDWFGHGDQFDFAKPYPDFDMARIAQHAREKGVRIIGHHETGGNIAVYEPQLEKALKYYEDLGINLIKTGYVADAGGITAPAADGNGQRFEWHEGQVASVHHLKVVEAAARHKIAINAHEPIKDSGLRRTYPNWVAREGARGMEYNAGWANSGNPANHEATLVFGRMLAGPMDFTPGVLSLLGKPGGDYLNSTLAKQLGLYVVLYSPIQMAADEIDDLAKFPRELTFIRQVPADWAETRMLDAAIGEYVVFARKDRNSKDWYVGGVTDDKAREVTARLDFLDKGRVYTATIYRDGDDADYKTDKRHSIAIETRTVRKGDVIPVRMAAAGGFAIRIAAGK